MISFYFWRKLKLFCHFFGHFFFLQVVKKVVSSQIDAFQIVFEIFLFKNKTLLTHDFKFQVF